MRSDVPDFKNVVVVRFSVRSPLFEKKFLSSKAEAAREQWFKFRASLYESSLGASLSVQSVKPAATYLFFDEADRQLYEQYFHEGNFYPIFASNTHHEIMSQHIYSHGLHVHTIVSRIDSDDIIEKRYIEKINAIILAQHERKELGSQMLTACKRGYRTNFSKIQELLHASPPFINHYFANFPGGKVTFNHTKLREMKVQCIYDESAEWLQIIHGTSVANKFKSPTTGASTLNSFNNASSQFGRIQNFNAKWFEDWSGIPSIRAELFESKRLPLSGFMSRARYIIRLWLGRV